MHQHGIIILYRNFFSLSLGQGLLCQKEFMHVLRKQSKTSLGIRMINGNHFTANTCEY